jgi:transmembrane serine protease 3
VDYTRSEIFLEMWTSLAACLLAVIYFGGASCSGDDSRRIAPRASPMGRTANGTNCQFRQYDSLYFYGPMIKKVSNIADHDQCVLQCTKTKMGAKKCEAVNYLQNNKRCEMMYQKFNVNDLTMITYYGDLNPSSAYLIPINCKEPSDQNPKPDQEKPKPDTSNPNPQPDQTKPVLPDQPKPDIPKGTCGQTQNDPMANTRSNHRIIGGKESIKHSVPWIVSLRQGFTAPLKHFCGGTLIRVNDGDETDIVITAAHCNEEGLEPDMVHIVAGTHTDEKTVTPGEQTVEYDQWISHPEYHQETMENDIAIMKLAKPIKFGNNVQPACLPEPSDNLPDDTKGLVAGWGTTIEGKDASRAGKLQQLIVPIVNAKKCADFYKKAEKPKNIIEKLMLCAGHLEGGKDSCQGDSGGPLTFKSAKGYTLQGVVSFGQGCARKEMPGIYARVTQYRDWINEKVKELSDVAKKG